MHHDLRDLVGEESPARSANPADLAAGAPDRPLVALVLALLVAAGAFYNALHVLGVHGRLTAEDVCTGNGRQNLFVVAPYPAKMAGVPKQRGIALALLDDFRQPELAVLLLGLVLPSVALHMVEEVVDRAGRRGYLRVLRRVLPLVLAPVLMDGWRGHDVAPVAADVHAQLVVDARVDVGAVGAVEVVHAAAPSDGYRRLRKLAVRLLPCVKRSEAVLVLLLVHVEVQDEQSVGRRAAGYPDVVVRVLLPPLAHVLRVVRPVVHTMWAVGPLALWLQREHAESVFHVPDCGTAQIRKLRNV